MVEVLQKRIPFPAARHLLADPFVERETVHEPQFFVADAAVFYGLIADVLDRLVPQTDEETIDPDTLSRIKDAIAQGKVKSGDLVCLVAFGAGLTWGSVFVRM